MTILRNTDIGAALAARRRQRGFFTMPGGMGSARPAGGGGGGGGSDPDRASRLLVLHCDGANNGTTFTDSSPYARTATVAGTLITSTSSPKFGTAAALVQANGDCVSFASAASLNVGTNPLTIWAFVKPTYSGVYGSFIGKGINGSNDFQVFVGDSGVVFRTEGQSDLTAGASLNDGNWHFIKVVLTAGPGTRYKKIFIDGPESASTTTTADINNSATFIIGSNGDSGGGFRFAGRFDEVVISALEDLSTTVPTSALPDS